MLRDFQWLFGDLFYINDFHIFQIQLQILIHTLDILHQSSLKYFFLVQKKPRIETRGCLLKTLECDEQYLRTVILNLN